MKTKKTKKTKKKLRNHLHKASNNFRVLRLAYIRLRLRRLMLLRLLLLPKKHNAQRRQEKEKYLHKALKKENKSKANEAKKSMAMVTIWRNLFFNHHWAWV